MDRDVPEVPGAPDEPGAPERDQAAPAREQALAGKQAAAPTRDDEAALARDEAALARVERARDEPRTLERDEAALTREKSALRNSLLAARARLSPDQRAAAGRAIRDAVLALPQAQMAGTIAAYYSVATEPDTRGLVYALWKRGTYVLLPVLLADGDLDWASYEGPDSLRAGPRGLAEPAEPPRGVMGIASADLVLVPAVAVDRQGYRLGRGGGSYDRALTRVGGPVPTVALLYDGELLEEVPVGQHDQRVRLIARPSHGITRLPLRWATI